MNPAIVETTKMMAGIANAERITDENKTISNKMLNKLLKIIEKDVNIAAADAAGIVHNIT